MRFDALVALFVRTVKRETTMENVNKTRTQRKFLVKQVSIPFIEPIVHVDNWPFDHRPLLWGENVQ